MSATATVRSRPSSYNARAGSICKSRAKASLGTIATPPWTRRARTIREALPDAGFTLSAKTRACFAPFRPDMAAVSICEASPILPTDGSAPRISACGGSDLTAGGAYVTAGMKTSFKGYYRVGGHSAALIRSFVQFDGEGQTANAREREIGGHATVKLAGLCLMQNPAALTPTATAMCRSGNSSITRAGAATAARAGRRRMPLRSSQW